MRHLRKQLVLCAILIFGASQPAHAADPSYEEIVSIYRGWLDAARPVISASGKSPDHIDKALFIAFDITIDTAFGGAYNAAMALPPVDGAVVMNNDATLRFCLMLHNSRGALFSGPELGNSLEQIDRAAAVALLKATRNEALSYIKSETAANLFVDVVNRYLAITPRASPIESRFHWNRIFADYSFSTGHRTWFSKVLEENPWLKAYRDVILMEVADMFYAREIYPSDFIERYGKITTQRSFNEIMISVVQRRLRLTMTPEERLKFYLLYPDEP